MRAFSSPTRPASPKPHQAVAQVEAVARLGPLDTGGYLARTSNGHSVEVSRQAARDLRKRLGLRKADDES